MDQLQRVRIWRRANPKILEFLYHPFLLSTSDSTLHKYLQIEEFFNYSLINKFLQNILYSEKLKIADQI